ncbi:hypothetical protein ACCD11_16870, partial [Variovorax sp. Varisp36]
MPATVVSPPPERSLAIAQARRELIEGESPPRARGAACVDSWITRSWQRCIEAGRRPQQRVSFDPVSRAVGCDVAEHNRALVSAARPVIDRLSRAIADTRYFAILTNADGIVIDVGNLPGGGGAPPPPAPPRPRRRGARGGRATRPPPPGP